MKAITHVWNSEESKIEERNRLARKVDVPYCFHGYGETNDNMQIYGMTHS